MSVEQPRAMEEIVSGGKKQLTNEKEEQRQSSGGNELLTNEDEDVQSNLENVSLLASRLQQLDYDEEMSTGEDEVVLQDETYHLPV